MSKHICPNCGQFYLKQITSKKNSKKYWVCQAPEEVCDAIYNDDDGKPDFPAENPEALLCVEFLAEHRNALNDKEREFIDKLVQQAEQQVDKPLAFSEKQLKFIRSIADRFTEAPDF